MGRAGVFAGAVAVGQLPDRSGRKTLCQATLAVFSVATGLCAAAGGYASLLLMRFLVGAGLGGELPVASTLVSELSPKAHRGKLVVILESFWAFGRALAAVVAYLLIPTWGWRAGFLVGALPVLYVLWLRRAVPSPTGSSRPSAASTKAVAVVGRGAGVRRTRGAPRGRPTPRLRAAGVGHCEPRRRSAHRHALGAVVRDGLLYYGIFHLLPSLLVARAPGWSSPSTRSSSRPPRSRLLQRGVAGGPLGTQADLVRLRAGLPSRPGPSAAPPGLQAVTLTGLVSFFNLRAWGGHTTPRATPPARRGRAGPPASGEGQAASNAPVKSAACWPFIPAAKTSSSRSSPPSSWRGWPSSSSWGRRPRGPALKRCNGTSPPGTYPRRDP